MSQRAHKVAKIDACSKAQFSPYVSARTPAQTFMAGDHTRPLFEAHYYCHVSLEEAKPCTDTFKVSAPLRCHLASSWGCTLQFGSNLIMFWYTGRCRPAVPRVLRGCRKPSTGDPQHIPTLFAKGKGFDNGIGMAAWVGLLMGEKGVVSGCELCWRNLRVNRAR